LGIGFVTTLTQCWRFRIDWDKLYTVIKQVLRRKRSWHISRYSSRIFLERRRKIQTPALRQVLDRLQVTCINIKQTDSVKRLSLGRPQKKLSRSSNPVPSGSECRYHGIITQSITPLTTVQFIPVVHRRDLSPLATLLT